MLTPHKRIRLSFLVARTQKLLFWLFFGICLALGCAYLFLMNHLAMKGYILTRETVKGVEIARNLEQIDTQIARFQTREYVTKLSEKDAMVHRKRPKFVVMRDVVTARR